MVNILVDNWKDYKEIIDKYDKIDFVEKTKKSDFRSFLILIKNYQIKHYCGWANCEKCNIIQCCEIIKYKVIPYKIYKRELKLKRILNECKKKNII